MAFKEYITAKNIIFLILLLLFFKFATYTVDILMLFFAAFVFASSLLPLVGLLSKKMKRSVAIILVMALSIVSLFAIIIPIFVVIVQQIGYFAIGFPHRLLTLHSYLSSMDLFGYKIPQVLNIEAILSGSAEFAKNILNQSWSITLSVFNLIILFIAIVTIVFYFLQDSNYLQKKFIEFFPERMKKKARYITSVISQKVGGYVIAQILSNTSIWIMVTLMLLVLRVDYPLLLGLIAGLLDIIPVVGPTLALLMIVITAYQQGWLLIVVIVVLFLAIQQASNNIIKPVVFGKFLDLHPLTIIFALFVAAKFLGVWGVILSPAIAATVCVLIDELYIKNINKQK